MKGEMKVFWGISVFGDLGCLQFFYFIVFEVQFFFFVVRQSFSYYIRVFSSKMENREKVWMYFEILYIVFFIFLVRIQLYYYNDV